MNYPQLRRVGVCLAFAGAWFMPLVVSALDHMPPQVLVESRFIEANRRETLLNKWIDDTPSLHPIHDAGISVSGHVEGSFNFGLNGFQTNQTFQGRAFDDYHSMAALNQVDLKIGRRFDLRDHKLNFGFLVDSMYGQDAALIHANGAFNFPHTYQDSDHPKNQFDVVQAYGVVGLPVGNGLSVTVGKWADLFGTEQIDSTADRNFGFYSRSYIFNFGLPKTESGAFGTYAINDRMSVVGGFSRGWDQFISDDNGAIDGLWKCNWLVSRQFRMSIGGTIGPELPGNDRDYRTMVDVDLSYCPDPCCPWRFGLESLVIYERNHADYEFQSINGWTHAAAAAYYMAYRVNRRIEIAGRLEWYGDANGTTLRVPNGDQTFLPDQRNMDFVGIERSINLFDVGLSARCRPFTTPKILRPLEIDPNFRVDYSNRHVFKNGNLEHQETLGLQMLYRF